MHNYERPASYHTNLIREGSGTENWRRLSGMFPVGVLEVMIATEDLVWIFVNGGFDMISTTNFDTSVGNDAPLSVLILFSQTCKQFSFRSIKVISFIDDTISLSERKRPVPTAISQ